LNQKNKAMRAQNEIEDMLMLVGIQRTINKRKCDLNDDPLVSESVYNDMILLNDRLLAKEQTLRWVLGRTNYNLSDEKLEM
jgi:hypothetical protein